MIFNLITELFQNLGIWDLKFQTLYIGSENWIVMDLFMVSKLTMGSEISESGTGTVQLSGAI